MNGINLDVEDGEFFTLLGPSGCGKTTTLRMIAGLETPSAGRIFIGGRDFTDTHPRDRDVAMVFQSYALYPHMTVRENLGLNLGSSEFRPRRLMSGSRMSRACWTSAHCSTRNLVSFRAGSANVSLSAVR